MGKALKVFVNGSFDVLHTGHLKLLNTARSMGDYLLVAVDSDRRISEKKGPSRPFNNLQERVALMQNLKAVNEVVVFDTDEQLEMIIEAYSPDVMVVGSDWKGKRVIGEQFAKRLVFYDRVCDASTTKKLESYFDRRLMYG